MSGDRRNQGSAGGNTAANEPTAFLREERDVLIQRLRRIAEHSPRTQRYDVIGTIARGGMGRVLEVWDRDLQRELAMKVIDWHRAGVGAGSERTAYERMLARFVEEARVTSRLDHPGIVPVHEIAFDREGALYYTMPLVRGRDFESVVASAHQGEDGWTLTRAVGVLLKVCETVAFAHSKGIVHRDLKPTNVMVGPFGEAYVMDWGLALVLGRKDAAELVGTPAYMAPEQAGLAPGEVGPLADVYSLGAMLYHLLAGRMPHAESSVAGPIDAVGRTPAPLAEVTADVPPELVAISEKAMARDPAERYPSVAALASDLRAFLEGRVVAVHDARPIAHLRKWARRNPALAIAVQALLLVLVGAVTVILVQQRRSIEVLAQETYAANLHAIDLGLRVSETAELTARLAECPPELRGWEWQHLSRRADSSFARLDAHGVPLFAVAFDPRGSVVATGADDGSVTLWDPDSAEALVRIESGVRDVRALCISPEGVLAAGLGDGSVRLWTLDGAPAGALPLPGGSCSALAFEPGGERLWIGDEAGGVHALRLPGGEVEVDLERPPGLVRSLAVTRDLRTCYATYVDDSLVAWDVPTAFVERSVRVEGAGRLALAPDGATLALGTLSGEVRLLDAATLAERTRLVGHGRAVTDVAFDRSGELVVSASFDTTVRLWRAADGTPLATWLGHADEVNGVAFHPDGKRVASVSRDGTARLWSLERQPAIEVALDEYILAATFDPGGERVLVADRDGRVTAIAVDGREREEVAVFPAAVGCLAFSPDGRFLAVGSKEVELLDASSLVRVRTLSGHEEAVFSLAFSPDGRRLATRSAETVVRLWDPDTGECLATLPRIEGDVAYPLAFDRTGRRLATGHAGGVVRLWRVPGGELLDTVRVASDTPLVTCLAWSPTDDLLAIGTFDRSIYLLEPGEPGMRELTHHVNWVSALAFSPDGRRLVSGSQDKTVRIWDPAWGDLLLTLRGHESTVTSVTFDPAGKNLASTDHQGRLRLWLGGSGEPEPPRGVQ